MELFRCLIGSQNYGLDDETSDKDYYVYHIPTFEDLYHNKPLVREEKTEEGILFHKDIRSLSNMIIKSSFNQLEVLFSDEFIVSSKYHLFYKFLIENREQIARANMNRLFNSVCGEVKRRINDLQKGKYTAGTEHLFKKYGYDTKNAMHAVRLINLWFMVCGKFTLEEAFKIQIPYFTYEGNDVLTYLDIKYGELSLTEILGLLDKLEKRLIPKLKGDFTDHSIDTNRLLNEMNTHIFNIVRESACGTKI